MHITVPFLKHHTHRNLPVTRPTTTTEVAGLRVALLNIGFTISVALSIAITVVISINAAQTANGLSPMQLVPMIIYLILMTANAIGCLTIAVFDYNTHMHEARLVARATMASLFASVVLGIILSGLSVFFLLYVFQFVCLVTFQTYTDSQLARNRTFDAPWHTNADPLRREYIPLNFFNIFWVFLIASIMGLLVETIYFAIVFGSYPDRAGLLWGPFSPIYGFGATLMTIALNRYWNRSTLIIFLVAGIIGAAFEFFTSLFMETAFGIVAWDYTGTFLNIQGRTNFAFFCAWGFLGLVWIKLFLPNVLKLVDTIPVKWRIALTSLAALFIAVDVTMTLLTLDCWYQRASGKQPENAIELFCAEYYNNSYMAHRFESMNLDPTRAERIG